MPPTRQEFLAGVISGAKRALKGLMDASERMYGEDGGKTKDGKSTDLQFARPPANEESICASPDKHEVGRKDRRAPSEIIDDLIEGAWR